jgi:cysteinyl-tRNA synthetase
MSMKYLGESFDIHGGGMENLFPHHEDEIAQAEAATGKPFVKYWLHNNMVTVGGQKMGKSLGNFITLKAAYEKWDPMVVRFLILQSHYRSPLDFSEESLAAAKTGYERLAGATTAIRKCLVASRVEIPGPGTPSGLIPEAADLVDTVRSRFTEAMDDDFNTPVALSALFDFARESNKLISSGGGNRESFHRIDAAYVELGTFILGLDFRAEAVGAGLTERLIQVIIWMRENARKAKDFAAADRFRKSLEDVDIVLEDTPQGTKWRFK